MICYVDILPTILNYVGQISEIAKDGRRLGRSFLSVLEADEEHPEWNEVYGSHTFHEITNYWPTSYICTR